MKRILLTGATGFIGQQCLPLLLEQGYEVHAVSSKRFEEIKSEIYWHRVDLLDSVQISKWMSSVQPSHLLHFAWYLVPGKYATAPENVLWVQNGLELLRKFHECGGRRVVIAGSCFEYDWSYGYCSEFVTPRKPSTLYGICKNALQDLLDGYASEIGLSSAWGRIFFLYGPHEHPARLVPSVIRSLLRGDRARCTSGDQIRDYLHVQDVANAFVTLLESNIQGPVNIASGRPIALKDIIFKIADKLNGQDLIQLGALPTPENESPLVIGDVSRLFKEVGWRPKYDLNHGLDKTIDWWRHLKNNDQPE